MIDEIDHRLKKWLATVIDDNYQISFEAPGRVKDQPVLSVYLYAIENAAPISTTREIPFQAILSYLVTIQSKNQIEAHKFLGKILLEAKSRSEFEVGFPALSADFWLAFDVMPLPHFSLRYPLTVARKSDTAPKIKSPPQVEIGSITQLTGIVVGPGSQPISRAKVMHSKSKTVTYTDQSGRFSISTKMNQLNDFKFQIDAKGQHFEIEVPLKESHNSSVTIHLDSLEV